ncbi:MAG TPA: 30S ribosome-binding factor RbfA [Myxococcaceae bacterium]|nr:30S ribosome-binding factor RbfA [Myxococcaceae bacterium]
MTTHVRPDRVGQEIQAAIASLITRGELRDPRIGFITITGVKVSPDLRVAKVYYSMLGTDQERSESQKGLEAAKGFIRREVTARIQLRVSPEIYFVFDKSIVEGDKIDRLLREVKEKEGW